MDEDQFLLDIIDTRLDKIIQIVKDDLPSGEPEGDWRILRALQKYFK